MHVSECPQCGAPAGARARACQYCKAEFLVSSLHSLHGFDRAGIDKYLQTYRGLVRSSPEEPKGHFSLGLCYLRLAVYDLAIRHLSKAVELAPDEADMYYYYGLAMMRGRRPKAVPLSEIRKIEEYIYGAIQLDGRKAKYYCLAAIIKYDHYFLNGMRVQPPSWEELLDEAQVALWEPDEIDRLLEAVVIREAELINTIRAMM